MDSIPKRRRSLSTFIVLLGATACTDVPEPAAVADHWLRVDATGQVLEVDETQSHRCVLDQRTGLMWQVARAKRGLYHYENRYTWYSDDSQRHMSEPGRADGGECAIDGCDTESVVKAVNRRRLCGHGDWRLPEREELLTLGDVRLRDTGNVLDPAFFPHAVPGEYWTADTFRLYPESAWAVDTRTGLDRVDRKTEPKAVRLVRRHAEPEQESQ